jgi:hypothetical protein
MKRRQWILLKALESTPTLKEALDLAKQTADFLELKDQTPSPDTTPNPLQNANGYAYHTR